MYSVSRLLFLLVLLLVPAAAKAADTDIYVEKGATQEETNKSIVTQLIAISYPAQIAGFSKTSMVKYKSDLSDYSAEYRFNAC